MPKPRASKKPPTFSDEQPLIRTYATRTKKDGARIAIMLIRPRLMELKDGTLAPYIFLPALIAQEVAANIMLACSAADNATDSMIEQDTKF